MNYNMEIVHMHTTFRPEVQKKSDKDPRPILKIVHMHATFRSDVTY